MTEALIAIDRLGPITRLCHNRPEARNAENASLLLELDAALREAAEDPEVRVVILGGKGDHFSAGHDLKEAAKNRSAFNVEQRWAFEEEHYFQQALNIWNFPKPTIAQVQGACVAGGFMVANMCDLVVAADDAFFADPVTHSMAAASVEVLVHPWVMGLRAAKKFLFTGERMSAEEAYRIGLVSEVVPRADLEDATMRLAERIASAPPFAIKLVKRSLNRTADMQGFTNALEAHFGAHQLSHFTDELKAINRGGLDSAIARGKAQVSA
jgi:enoyl-CoA hydratase